MKYTAIVLAGSRPGPDPFAQQFGNDIKALIAVAGEPMVRRPVRALLASDNIASVIVLTQAPDRIAAILPADERIALRRSRGTIAETILELCNDLRTPWPLLVTTADHALLDMETVDEFCAGAEEADVAVGVVEQSTLLRRFPDAERTWLKFRKGAYTGANLFALRSSKVAPAIELWRSVEQDRKKGWRIIALVGPGTLIGTFIGWLSLDEVLKRLGRKLRLDVRAVRLSNPVSGVDVDKPSDHTLVEDILAGRA